MYWLIDCVTNSPKIHREFSVFECMKVSQISEGILTFFPHYLILQNVHCFVGRHFICDFSQGDHSLTICDPPVLAKFKHITNIETCTLLCCDHIVFVVASMESSTANLAANMVLKGAHSSDKNVKNSSMVSMDRLIKVDKKNVG